MRPCEKLAIGGELLQGAVDDGGGHQIFSIRPGQSLPQNFEQIMRVILFDSYCNTLNNSGMQKIMGVIDTFSIPTAGRKKLAHWKASLSEEHCAPIPHHELPLLSSDEALPWLGEKHHATVFTVLFPATLTGK